MFARLIAVLFLAFCCSAMPARAENGANVMLVLDASGSMWGKVGDQTKMAAARETVATILDKWRPEDKLGLVVYGHRRKGDCSDIEVMSNPEAVDKDALMAKIGAISPKGRTPMTEAMRVAAEQLTSVEGKATVILVSDGVETCEADPCAVAASLKQQDVDLVVHTVGFDIQDAEAKGQLACIAENTGGLALMAADASSLIVAIEQAVAVAKAAEPAPQPAPPPPPAPIVEAKPEWNAIGTVRLAAGDDPLAGGKDDTIWDFRKPAPAGSPKGESIAYSYNPQIKTMVPPGEYDLYTQVGATEVVNRVTVKADEMNKFDIVLNAGRIGLRAKRTETENQTGDVAWDVRDRATGKSVFYSYYPEASGIIPAGEYTVKLTIGAAEVTRDIEIAPGDTEAVEIVAGVARVEAKIVFSNGGPSVKEPATNVFAGTEIQDGQSSIAFSYDSNPKWDLPAGPYVARVEVNGVKRQFSFEVKAGEGVKAEWALDAGLVDVDAPGAELIEFFDPEGDIYGDLKSIGSAYAAKTLQVMPAGKVKVTARKGEKVVETIVDVAAGKRIKVQLPVEP